MKEPIRYYVESGDLFSFQREESPQRAAEHHVWEIMNVTKATLGEKIVVKNDYRGKVVATFSSTEIIKKLNRMDDIKYKLAGNRIHFTKTPLGRSSTHEYWQNLFKVGVKMEKSGGVWIQCSVRVNPVTGDFTGM